MAAGRKAKPFPLFPQRAGVWCEPVGKQGRSTFQAAGESRKGKPFTAVSRGSDGKPPDKLGGNAGESLSSLNQGRGFSFFIAKAVRG